MIGTSFLEGWDYDFLQSFMVFQDSLEDVTAKSVILPKPVALLLMLWPLQRKRLPLQRTIQSTGRLEQILQRSSSMERNSTISDSPF
jgi:hypothetical protein